MELRVCNFCAVGVFESGLLAVPLSHTCALESAHLRSMFRGVKKVLGGVRWKVVLVRDYETLVV